MAQASQSLSSLVSGATNRLIEPNAEAVSAIPHKGGQRVPIALVVPKQQRHYASSLVTEPARAGFESRRF